ncbi:MAG: helix-turn-helix domain-containing protein [Spirochaetales bacterium]|nr:helix-turn-helix domain-containing protein [Spirochaetales bacterium]MCF7938204.1 helix-turn-helix domain-containing protein [Spirochaetales bacterium]
MESIGEKLRSTREAKGISTEQAARETHIAKRYIHALEEEHFEEFPGEPYLLGFLRTYSDYLNLSSGELVNLYKNYRIQEQPVPMEELLETKSRGRGGKFVLLAVIIAAAVAGGFFLYPGIADWFSERRETRMAEEASNQEETLPAGTTITFSEEILERRFYEGDSIRVDFKSGEYPVRLLDISENLTISAPLGERELSLGEQTQVDLDGEGGADITMILKDIDPADPDKGAILRFDRVTQTAEETKPGSPSEGVPSPGAASSPDRSREASTVMTADLNEPFSLDIAFRGACLFRYVSDNTERRQRYYQKGETLSIDVNETVRMWASNAGAVTIRVDSQDVELGRPGEVAVAMLTWEESGGDYDLRLVPMY